MKHFFTYLILFSLFFISSFSIAQTDKESVIDETSLGLNIVKVNLTAIPLGNFSFQYERAVAKKISIGVGLRVMPKSRLPLKGLIKDVIDDDDSWRHFENLKISNFAITPEVRFYMGKSVFRGFYIAPFARFANYTVQTPFEFEYDHPLEGPQEETIPLDGKISTFTGGFMLGAQWKLPKSLYLDWWILGPHYGTSNGDIKGNKTLSPEEQHGIRESLGDLDDLPFVEGYEVDSSGARVDIKGPWGGIRAGIALGFRF
jgi:hypothetical protein